MAIFDLLRKLLGSANSHVLMERYMCPSAVFGQKMLAKLNGFQDFVRLPHKSFYSKIFLEPLALAVTNGHWILHDAYDAALAAKVAEEFATVIHVAIGDGEIELLRKVLFAIDDVSMVKYFCDVVPLANLAVLSNSSPDFLATPLHNSSLRIAIMAYFEQLAEIDSDFAGRIEMTTLYANFRHFTALGESLQIEGERMLRAFTQQNFKKSLLDSTKDIIKRQAKVLEEIESRLASASNFFIQDAMFERCAACLQQLHLLSVQKKHAANTRMVLGLTHDQAMQQLFALEDPQDIFSVAFGYQITSDDDWAAILYRQVVHNGNRDLLRAYKAQCIALSPDLLQKLVFLANADAAGNLAGATGGASSGAGGGVGSGGAAAGGGGGGSATSKDRKANFKWLEEELTSVFASPPPAGSHPLSMLS